MQSKIAKDVNESVRNLHLLPVGAAHVEKETTENNLKLAKEWQKDNAYQKQKDAKKKEQVKLDKQKGVIEKRENRKKAHTIRNKLVRQEKALRDEQIAWYQRQILVGQRNAESSQKELSKERSFMLWKRPYTILLIFQAIFFTFELLSLIYFHGLELLPLGIQLLPLQTEETIPDAHVTVMDQVGFNELNYLKVEENEPGHENWILSDSSAIGIGNLEHAVILHSTGCVVSLACIVAISFNIYTFLNYMIPPLLTMCCFIQKLVCSAFFFYRFVDRCQMGRCGIVPTIYAMVVCGFLHGIVCIFGIAIPFDHMMRLCHPPFFYTNNEAAALEDGQMEDITTVEKHVKQTTKYTDVPIQDKEHRYQRKMTLLADFQEEVVHEGKQDEIKAEKKKRKKKKKKKKSK